MKMVVFLFGEAEKGEYCAPLLVRSLPHLIDILGNPPEESQGIPYAIQTLLFQRELIYFRVKEEGFSLSDYKKGLKILENEDLIPRLSAICLPGIGDREIIEECTRLCHLHKSCMIINEKDLYDYLTANP